MNRLTKKIATIVILVILICEASFSNNKEFSVNGIYHIVNPTNNTELVVNGSGKILAKNSDEASNLTLLEDEKTQDSNFYYKMEILDNFENEEYKDDLGIKHITKKGRFHSIFYDKNGKEIGLDLVNVYGASFALNDYIAYNFYDDNNNDSSLFLFNAKTKEKKKMEYDNIYYFSNHPIVSAPVWDESPSKKSIIIYDDDFNEVKRIDVYSVSSVMDKDKANMLHIVRKGNGVNGLLDNFLDTNFNKVFENDVDVLNYSENSNIITIKDKDKYYDYDLKLRTKVGSEKPYSEYEKQNSYSDRYSLYEATLSNIKNSNKKFTFVMPKFYKNKVIFQADIEPSIFSDRFPSVIFSEDLKKSKEFKTINLIDEENGKIFANNGEVYDFDLNLVKKLGDKIAIESYTCNNKTFYIDMFNTDYEIREKFNLYDDKLNILLKDIKYCDFYTFKDKIQVEDENSTKIYDTDLNIIKDFKRRIRASSFYESTKYAFTDSITKRMGIIDENYNIIIDKLKAANNLKKYYFTYQNGFKYGLMDYNGKALISFSIFDTMKEDSNQKDYKKGEVDGYVW